MSRFKSVVGVVTLAVVMSLAGVVNPSPAAATYEAPPPLTADRCGTKLDQFYIPDVDTPAYLNSQGEYLPNDVWLSTGGATTVTVIARKYGEQDVPFVLKFSAEPESSCVEALDTVTTRVEACNRSNNGTRVAFTYTNVDDLTDRWHSDPYIYVKRWDDGQSAEVWPAFGRVEDGASATVIGGDANSGGGPTEFYLSPGTYSMSLRTDETGTRTLPNRLFVPACGTSKPPKGDPMGGPIPGAGSRSNQPKARLGKCRAHKVPGLLDGRKATKLTRYKVVVNPKKGKTKRLPFKVAAGKTKRLVLRKQKTGTVVKVVFAGKTITRKLKC